LRSDGFWLSETLVREFRAALSEHD
jgi:hypothetical protein